MKPTSAWLVYELTSTVMLWKFFLGGGNPVGGLVSPDSGYPIYKFTMINLFVHNHRHGH